MSAPAKQPTAIQLRRATAAYWTSIDIAPGYFVPRNGEPIYETDTGKMKIGDGTTRYSLLDYLADTASLANLSDNTINNLSDVTISSAQNDQGIIYENGQWKNKTVVAAASVAKIKPSPATDGALWFDPEDGRLYRYYVDADSTGQWIEVKQVGAEPSNTFTLPVTMQSTLNVSGATTLGSASLSSATISTPLPIASGGTGATTGVTMVPIIPTGVTVSSGSGSRNTATGVVTITSATVANINGIFSADYNAYKIIFYPTAGASDYIFLRMNSGGTQNNTTNYSMGSLYVQSATVGIWQDGSSLQTFVNWGYVNSAEPTTSCLTAEIINPFSSSHKTSGFYTSGYGIPNHTFVSGAFAFNGTNSFDGITIGNATAGNVSGTLQVFGMRNS
jgi:hypothetical protein